MNKLSITPIKEEYTSPKVKEIMISAKHQILTLSNYNTDSKPVEDEIG